MSLILLSCSREELLSSGDAAGIDPVDGDSLAVAFSADSFDYGWADADAADSGSTDSRNAETRSAETRASGTSWTEKDSVGIYMIPKSSGAYNYNLANVYWKNKKYIYSSSRLKADGTANNLYFPLDGSSVCFVAYYPYVKTAATANTVSFDFADQSTQAKKESKDFCFSRGTTGYKKGNTPQFKFFHKFSKIRMTVKQGDGGPSVDSIQVTLSKMPKTATVNLNNFSQVKADSITVGTASTTIKACTLSSSDTTATVEAIIAPHSSGTNFTKRVFTFTTKDGEEKTYELPDNVTFEAGYSYSFTFTLVANEPPTLVSDGMTNCYIVAPNTTLKFPVSRAYEHNGTSFTATLRTGGTYASTFTAAVVWADAAVINGTPSVSGSGNTAEVTVKTNTSVSGNAVVKIYKSSDTSNKVAVWSYHIWVTDYNPTKNRYTNKMNTNNKSNPKGYFIFMDRNLGATKASTGSGIGTGLFYQWGRKDPFPATDDTPTTGSWSKVATTSALGTVTNTIKNPSVFYTASSGSDYDWHYASRDNTLWGHDVNGGIKTIYDPCPSGWRVPVNSGMSSNTSPWYGFTSSNGGTFANGYNWGTNAVYPAAGYRSSSSGSLSVVGTYGSYWSASPYSSTSYYASLLRFDSGNVSVYNNAYRANGLSVRCSQE